MLLNPDLLLWAVPALPVLGHLAFVAWRRERQRRERLHGEVAATARSDRLEQPPEPDDARPGQPQRALAAARPAGERRLARGMAAQRLPAQQTRPSAPRRRLGPALAGRRTPRAVDAAGTDVYFHVFNKYWNYRKI